MKNDNSLYKSYITEALLILLKDRNLSDITIKEITKKAGVNRSTYYRNFNSQEDIIKYFYSSLLMKCVSNDVRHPENLKSHLENIFNQFLLCKEDLLCLHKHELTYLLLEVLNSFFITNSTINNHYSFNKKFEFYYHTGGIFNTLILWFDCDMNIDPQQLASYSIKILPNNFVPLL